MAALGAAGQSWTLREREIVGSSVVSLTTFVGWRDARGGSGEADADVVEYGGATGAADDAATAAAAEAAPENSTRIVNTRDEAGERGAAVFAGDESPDALMAHVCVRFVTHELYELEMPEEMAPGQEPHVRERHDVSDWTFEGMLSGPDDGAELEWVIVDIR